jgi:hypothetical protein
MQNPSIISASLMADLAVEVDGEPFEYYLAGQYPYECQAVGNDLALLYLECPLEIKQHVRRCYI